MEFGRNYKLLTRIFACALVAIFTAIETPAFASGLEYMETTSDTVSHSPMDQATRAPSKLTPVSYGTNYETEFSRYSSFMKAPHEGGVQSLYGNNANPAMMNINDPYMASEISPYSKYSPYLEVVGEGSDYTLGIDDVVTVIVRNQPDFSGRFIVDPEGNLQYNFVGDIKAEGKTKEELKQDVIESLKKFIRFPEVAVMISEYRSKAVYVFGYVSGPGKYAMKGNKITVKEAVVAAGLPREDAALKRVYVIRPSEFTESGKPEKQKVNLKKLLYKGESVEDFILQPGDTIIVNQKYFDKFVQNFERITRPLFQGASVYALGWGGFDNGIFGSSSSSSDNDN